MNEVCTMDNQCTVPPTEGTLQGTHLLVCSSCVAEEFPETYKQLIEGNQSIMGCPLKQTGVSFTKKIKMLIELKSVEKITLAMTEKSCSPCLRGAVRDAVTMSGRKIFVDYILVEPDGTIML